jgi:hypothetical protein
VEYALDGTGFWQHDTNETHWVTFDLGKQRHVEQVRGRSNGDLNRDPTVVNIYVSNDIGDWGDAVATGINTWTDTDVWQYTNLTHKDGRYIKVEITATEDINNMLAWGGSSTGYYKVLDFYVSA